MATIEGQRRQVTVLFADMADYTPLAEKLGEEAVYTLMRDVIARMSESVHRHHGAVHNLTGDGMMALFGAPHAIEDAPLKACRAALDIQSAMRGLEDGTEARYGVRPKFRIGLNTGPIVVGRVGDDQETEITALGDTVNLASRLQAEADSGGIVMSATTHRLVDGYVDCDFAGAREIKGKAEAQPVYRLTGLKDSVTRFDIAVSRGLTELVGRGAETTTLQRCWEEARAGALRVVNIIGEAGIGKSRLVHDFRQLVEADSAFFLQGRCVASGTTTPFLPFIGVLRASFRMSPEMARDEAERRLAHGLENLGIAPEEPLPYLLNLLGYEVGGGVINALDSEVVGLRTRDALLRLLRERRRVSPVAMFIDDLHWMDGASQDLLVTICAEDRDLPLLLICAYRPEYAAPWVSLEGAIDLRLGHLTRDGTVALLRSRLGTEEIPDELVRTVHAKAEGNPLFAEEIASYLVERGVVETTETGVVYHAASDAVLPVTLENLLMDRVDRLAPGPRAALEAAAAIGPEFTTALVRAATDGEADVALDLDELRRQELIFADADDTWRFKHALVREAVYNSLLRPNRQALHERIATAIERAGGEEHADILAWHYGETENAAKAVRYLTLAGERSLTIYSLDAAEAHFRNAIARIEQTPGCVDDTVFVDVLLRLARVLYFTIDFFGIIALVERYQPVVERLGDRKRLARFLIETGYAHVFSAQHAVGKPMLERALAIGEEIGDQEIIGYASMALMWHYMRWEPPTPEVRKSVVDLSDTGFRIGQELKDVWLASKSLVGVAIHYSTVGLAHECRRSALRLMEYGRTSNDPRPRAMALWALAIHDSLHFNAEEAIANADEAMASGLSPIDHTSAVAGKSIALIMLGRAEEGLALLKPARERVWTGGLWLPLSASDPPQGLGMVLTGDIAGGVRWIEETRGRLESWGDGLGAVTADLFLGTIYLELAIGKERPSAAAMRRNLWFLIRTLPFAAARARRLLERAAAYYRQYDIPALLAWSLAELARLHAAKKRPAEARACLAEARPLAQSVELAPLVARIDAVAAALPPV